MQKQPVASQENAEMDIDKLFLERNDNALSDSENHKNMEDIPQNHEDHDEDVEPTLPKSKNKNDKDVAESQDDDTKDDESTQKPERANRIKELEEAKKKIENTERRYKDTAKSYNDLTRKVSSFGKIVKKYVADSILTEEEATALLENTKYEELEAEDQTPYQKYAKIWEEGVARMREFADDPEEINKRVYGFKQFLNDSTESELKEIWEEFEEAGDNIADLTRLMLKMGQKHCDDGFGEIYEAGSVKNFRQKMSETIEDLKKSLDEKDKIIDKLKKKHEDYTPVNLRVPQGGSNKSASIDNDDVSVEKLFEQRNNNIKFG